MKLKTCTCGLTLTTKNVTRVIRFKDSGTDVLYFNCSVCRSTMVLPSAETKKLIQSVKIAA